MKKNNKNRSTYIFRNRLIAGICVVVLIILLTLLLRSVTHGFGISQTQPSDEQENRSSAAENKTDNDTDIDSQPAGASESLDLSDINIYDRRLVLMNANVFPANYSVDDAVVADESTGESLKREAAEAFQEMQDAAEQDGISLVLSKGYCDTQAEEELIRDASDAIDQQEASEETLKNALREKGIFEQGDEHLLGYSADISSENDPEKLQQDAENWLLQHAAEYGFILRYPRDKEKITGVLYQPEHYRYVGSSNAAYLEANQLCLEELYASFMNDF